MSPRWSTNVFGHVGNGALAEGSCIKMVLLGFIGFEDLPGELYSNRSATVSG